MDICTDNRFEIIEGIHKYLVENTNIESSKEELKYLDNILFRLWQSNLLNIDTLKNKHIIK